MWWFCLQDVYYLYYSSIKWWENWGNSPLKVSIGFAAKAARICYVRLCQICCWGHCVPLIFIGPESDHWQCLSLTDSLTNSLPFSKLDRCDPGMWKCQLKTCFYCLAMLVTHWLTDSLTHSLTDSLTDSCLVDLMTLNDTNCLMFSQQLLKAVKRLKQLV